jgi:signal transduction histidine kinase/CheY-like chemotaxis protein
MRASEAVDSTRSPPSQTDPKRKEAQILTADRLASMGMLAAGIAHELNNPLGVTIANVSFGLEELHALDAGLTSAEGEGPAEMAARLARGRAAVATIVDALGEAWQAGDRARLIVRDLRTFSRADDERRVPVDVRRVVESAINMAYNEIRTRARLVKEYGSIPSVLGNEARLGQVFFNLLVNAAHAIPEGQIDEHVIRVTARAERQDGSKARTCVIEITDSGHGIARENLPRIFEPFFTTKRKNATGLGLSICQSIVTAMGGEITVESQIGKGSTFRVSLPGSEEEPVRTTTLAPPRASPSEAPRRRVLVIDDEPMMARAVQRLLDSEHDVVATSDPLAAVEQVRAGVRYDAILCDLMMPSMSGMEVYEAIARVESEQARRMVFMTGGAFTPSAARFLENIQNPRIEKPLEHATLRAILRKHLDDPK